MNCLLHGVETQHLHGGQKVLRITEVRCNLHLVIVSDLSVDGGLPEPRLEVPEDRGDGLHLPAGQLRGPAGGAAPHTAVSHTSSAHAKSL